MATTKHTTTTLTRMGVFITLICLAVFLFWKVALYIDLPRPGEDPVWYLSQGYSMARGEWLSSTFGHSSTVPYQQPYFYGVLTAPYLRLFQYDVYGLLLWNIILLVLITLLVYRILKEDPTLSLVWRIAILVAFIANPYLFGPRPEVLNLLLLLIMCKIMLDIQSPATVLVILACAFLTMTAGLIQPVGGVFAIAFFVGLAVQRKLKARLYFIYFAAVGILLAIFYLPVVLIDIDHWKLEFFERFGGSESRGTVNLGLIVKYFIYAPFLLLPWFLRLLRLRNVRAWAKELLIVATYLIVLLPFSRSYYFVLISAIFLWRFISMPNNPLPKILAYGLIVISPIFVLYWPTVQQIENRRYSSTFNQIITTVDTVYTEISPESHIWLPAQIAMPLIRQPNSRLFITYYRSRFGEGIPFREGDIALVTTTDELESLFGNLDETVDTTRLRVTELIPPVDGLITISPDFERSASIGLWEVTLENEQQ